MLEKDWIELLIAVVLSAMGGIVRKLSELEQYPKRKIKIKHYALSSIISCFVGIIMFAIFKHFESSTYLMMAAVAISGFIGSPIIHSLSALLLSRLKSEINGKIIDENDL